DDHLHLAVPRPRIVADRGRTVVRGEQRADQHPRTTHQQGERDEHHHEGDGVPATLRPTLGPPATFGCAPGAGGLLGGRVVSHFSGVVEEVRHVRSSSVSGSGAPVGAPSAVPGGLPLLRSLSSAACKIITAATWSTTDRCFLLLRPAACSA